MILGRLNRGPCKTVDLALDLELPTFQVRKSISGLMSMRLVEWTVDGWAHLEDVHETNEILASVGEPRTYLEELERWRAWQTGAA